MATPSRWFFSPRDSTQWYIHPVVWHSTCEERSIKRTSANTEHQESQRLSPVLYISMKLNFIHDVIWRGHTNRQSIRHKTPENLVHNGPTIGANQMHKCESHLPQLTTNQCSSDNKTPAWIILCVLYYFTVFRLPVLFFAVGNKYHNNNAYGNFPTCWSKGRLPLSLFSFQRHGQWRTMTAVVSDVSIFTFLMRSKYCARLLCFWPYSKRY
jgi:hypothetical protein